MQLQPWLSIVQRGSLQVASWVTGEGRKAPGLAPLCWAMAAK